MSRKFGKVILSNKRKGADKVAPEFEIINVDRENPVMGNFFVLWDWRDDEARVEVIAKYKERYEADWVQNGPMKQETLKIARKVYKGQSVALACWCSGAPTYKPCHAELIKARIEEVLAPYIDKQ